MNKEWTECDDDELGTEKEQVRLGWEAGQQIGWDSAEMAQYDNYDTNRQVN